MIKDAFIEMTLFQSAKETDNKLRWDVDVEGTNFALYIPKWRVPQPWPSKICVQVFPRRYNGDDNFNLSPKDIETDSSLSNEPIIATITKMSEHSKTIKYQPIGEQKYWEIGEPYIPTQLTYNELDKLRIIIFWDLRSRGLFNNSEDASK